MGSCRKELEARRPLPCWDQQAEHGAAAGPTNTHTPHTPSRSGAAYFRLNISGMVHPVQAGTLATGDRPTTQASRQEPTLGHSLPLSYRGAKLLCFPKALLGESSLGAVPTLPGARTGPGAAPGRGLAARGKQQLVVPTGTLHPRTGVSPTGWVSAP